MIKKWSKSYTILRRTFFAALFFLYCIKTKVNFQNLSHWNWSIRTCENYLELLRKSLSPDQATLSCIIFIHLNTYFVQICIILFSFILKCIMWVLSLTHWTWWSIQLCCGLLWPDTCRFTSADVIWLNRECMTCSSAHMSKDALSCCFSLTWCMRYLGLPPMEYLSIIV